MMDANLDPEDMDRLEALESKVDALVERFETIQTTVLNAWEKVEPLLGEVLPLIAKLEQSPMFRMMTAGGKKK